MRYAATLTAAFVSLSLSGTASATVVIGGMSFHDDAFADLVLDASPLGSGPFNRETSGSSQPLDLPADFAILQSAVVGSDITEWISLRTAAAQLTVGFTDLIPFDGPGPDISIIEIGVPATISVTIAGITQQYTSQPSGSVNMVLVDLSAFGVSDASTLTISSADILNDIAAVAAINSVPEPTGLVLAALGFIGIAIWGKRRAAFSRNIVSSGR